MAHSGDAFQVKVACHQLTLDFTLMDRTGHGIAEMMSGMRGTGTINNQRQAVLASGDANDPHILPSATEEPHRLHQPERTTHAAPIGSLYRWLSRRTNLHVSTRQSTQGFEGSRVRRFEGSKVRWFRGSKVPGFEGRPDQGRSRRLSRHLLGAERHLANGDVRGGGLKS